MVNFYFQPRNSQESKTDKNITLNETKIFYSTGL